MYIYLFNKAGRFEMHALWQDYPLQVQKYNVDLHVNVYIQVLTYMYACKVPKDLSVIYVWKMCLHYRAALNTIQNLKKILFSTRDEPSPDLLVHFKVIFTKGALALKH